MRAQWVAGRRITARAAVLMLAAVLMGLVPDVASAGAFRAWAQPSGQGSVARTLYGGAARSLCRDCFVVQHWDGTAWQPQDVGVNPRNGYLLDAVAATSSRNAWAVGDRWTDIAGNPVQRTWIEHWDGIAWTRQASPNPGGPYMDNELSAVAATSPDNAWAVGYWAHPESDGGGDGHTVILHWDGTAWTRALSQSSTLYGVTATSPTNAWAIGSG
jgi:hypothetical protein